MILWLIYSVILLLAITSRSGWHFLGWGLTAYGVYYVHQIIGGPV